MNDWYGVRCNAVTETATVGYLIEIPHEYKSEPGKKTKS